MKRVDPDGLPCPCGESSDAFKIDKNGWGHCFGSCGGKNFPPEFVNKEFNTVNIPVQQEAQKKQIPLSPLAEVYRGIPERGLTSETIKRYKFNVGREGDNFQSKAPIFDTDGNYIASKVRYLPNEGNNKPFSIEGDFSKAGLFGRHAFPPGSAKYITVTEGYEDAAAAFQIMGSKYPCVSVHSASSALKDCKADFEYLNSFENIVLALDADDPGRKAAKAISSLGFPIGKVKVLDMRKHKDANDYLKAKDGESFTREWWQAPKYKPDNILLGSDLWQSVIDKKDHFAVPYPFEGLNKLTFGLRLSELVVLTAATGVGKTSVIKHIEHMLLTNPEVKERNYGVGFLHLEESIGDTALGLISIHNGVPYHLPTSERPEADLRKAYDELINNDRTIVYDAFGSNDINVILDKIRHMCAMGVKYVVLDHLSIIVSGNEGDERKQLDEITTKLKTLTMELDICVIAIIHQNRQGQIRGTAGVEQLANIVMQLDRDKVDTNEWRRNVTKITVLKNRYSGYTGPASHLWYNPDTARLSELSEEEVLRYESGDSMKDDEVW